MFSMAFEVVVHGKELTLNNKIRIDGVLTPDDAVYILCPIR